MLFAVGNNNGATKRHIKSPPNHKNMYEILQGMPNTDWNLCVFSISWSSVVESQAQDET